MSRSMKGIQQYLIDHGDFTKTAATALLLWSEWLNQDLTVMVLNRLDHTAEAKLMLLIRIAIEDELIERGVVKTMQ